MATGTREIRPGGMAGGAGGGVEGVAEACAGRRGCAGGVAGRPLTVVKTPVSSLASRQMCCLIELRM